MELKLSGWSSLLLTVFAELRRCHALVGAEDTGDVAAVGETAGYGYVLDGAVAAQEKFGELAYAVVLQDLVD